MKMVVFGGTFDPPHIGHKSIADRLKDRFDRVVILPNKIPPHKVAVTAAEDRLQMCKAAFLGCEVSRLELGMPPPSYTFKTLLKIKEGIRADTELYYVIGADSVKDLGRWANPALLATLANYIIVPRAGYGEPERYINDFKRRYGGSFELLDSGVEDISSSDVRLLNAFREIDGVVTPQVAEYINRRGLYREFCYIVERFGEFGITESRKSHIKNVALTAIALSKAHFADTDAAVTAALLHDIAKYTDYVKAGRYGVNMTAGVSRLPAECLHAEIGAQIAATVFNITDDDIINAVRYHTTGRPDMSRLEQVIFVADYIEPGRTDIEGLEEIRRLAYSDLDKCVGRIIAANLKHLLASGKTPAAITIEAAKFYNKIN